MTVHYIKSDGTTCQQFSETMSVTTNISEATCLTCLSSFRAHCKAIVKKSEARIRILRGMIEKHEKRINEVRQNDLQAQQRIWEVDPKYDQPLKPL